MKYKTKRDALRSRTNFTASSGWTERATETRYFSISEGRFVKCWILVLARKNQVH